MITDKEIDTLFDEFEQVLNESNQPLIGLCVVVHFDGNAHVLGIGPKQHMEDIVACMKGSAVVGKREIN